MNANEKAPRLKPIVEYIKVLLRKAENCLTQSLRPYCKQDSSKQFSRLSVLIFLCLGLVSECCQFFKKKIPILLLEAFHNLAKAF